MADFLVATTLADGGHPRNWLKIWLLRYLGDPDQYDRVQEFQSVIWGVSSSNASLFRESLKGAIACGGRLLIKRFAFPVINNNANATASRVSAITVGEGVRSLVYSMTIAHLR